MGETVWVNNHMAHYTRGTVPVLTGASSVGQLQPTTEAILAQYSFVFVTERLNLAIASFLCRLPGVCSALAEKKMKRERERDAARFITLFDKFILCVRACVCACLFFASADCV